jgi:hypothetical protein
MWLGVISKKMTCERYDVLVLKGETLCPDCQQLLADELKEYYVLSGSKKHENMPRTRFWIFFYKLSMRLDDRYYKTVRYCCGHD